MTKYDAAWVAAEEAKRKWMAENSLYREEDEHASCGVGLVVSVEGKPTRRVVQAGIDALKAIWHRGAVDADGNLLFYKSYNVLHLGAQYRLNEHVAINARVNNLLDEDFTSFSTSFTANPDGSYTPVYTDDYNNKDKARSYWLSLNVSF